MHRNGVECDLPVVENVNDVVVLAAINVRGIEKLITRSITFIKDLLDSGEVEASIYCAVFAVRMLRWLQIIVLITQFGPVPDHIRGPKIRLGVGVKGLERIGR